MTTTNGRSADSRRSGRSGGQWLLGLLIVLALVASVLMVFTDQLSLAGSIAVIAALWAAVIGAIMVTKFRRQAESAEAKSRDLRLVYELQLEREISARRQYELDVEATIRKEVSEESNVELGELKKQVLALRSSLEMLLGESLPDSRVALPNEKLRELASGLGGSGAGPFGGQYTSGYGTAGGYAYDRPDDSVLAARDFAATAPAESGRTSDPGRRGPGRNPDDTVDPNEMTEVIPIIRDDEPISGRIATEVPFTPDEPFTPDDTVDVEEVEPEAVAAPESAPADAEPPAAPETAVPEAATADTAVGETDSETSAAETAAPEAVDATETVADAQPEFSEAEEPAAEQPTPVFVDDAPTDSWVADAAPQPDAGPWGPGTTPIPATAGRHEGGHTFNETTAPEPAAGRRHRREADDFDSAHSAGLPVSELLSQLRQSGSPGGGRRRRED